MSSAHTRRALVVGATGIAGQTVSQELMRHGWEVHGLARRTDRLPEGVHPVRADLLDAEATRAAVAGIRPEIVIITAWIRKDTEAENIEVNSRTLRNLFAALEPDGGVRHVALLTGLKHYLGPFEDYATGVKAETPFHESEPRLPSPNFYYAQEDELFAAAERLGFTWSVHRSHTILGFAVDNAMNMVLTLSVYATICKELGLPFVFPGFGRAVELHHGRDGCRPARRAARLGRDPPRGARTRRSTSRTATCSAGAGCGRRSPSTSASRGRGRPARRAPSKRR